MPTTEELFQQTQQSRIIAQQREQALRDAQNRLAQQQQEQEFQVQETKLKQSTGSGSEVIAKTIGVSREAVAEAQELVNRKTSGGRIDFTGKSSEVKRAYAFLIDQPENLFKLRGFAGNYAGERSSKSQPQLNEEVIKRIEAQTGIKIDREKVRESIAQTEAKLGYKITPTTGFDYSKINPSDIKKAAEQIIKQSQPSFSERIGQAVKQDSYGEAVTTLFPPRVDYNPAEPTIPQRFVNVYKERYREAQKLLSKTGVTYTPEQAQGFEIRLKNLQPVYDEYGYLISGVEYKDLPEDLKRYEQLKRAKGATELLFMGAGATPRAVIGGTISEVIAGERIIKNPLEVSGQVRYEPLRPTEPITGKPTYTIGQPMESFSYTDPLTGKLVTQQKYDVLGVNKEVVSEGRKTIIKANAGSRGRVIYEGIPTDKKGYQDAIKFLKKQGYTEREAREIIRLRRPVVQESYFRGQGVATIPEEGKASFSIIGREKVLPSKGQTGGINWLQKEPRIGFGTSVGTEEGKFFRVVSEQENAFLSKGKYPYTKLRQQGKIKDSFEGLVGSIEKKTYPKSGVTQYEELEVSRRMIPKQRVPSVSTAKVFVKQGEPLWSISDASLSEARGFMGGSGGRKSSQQFLKQLYKTDKLATSTILGLEKVKPIKISRPISTPKAPQVLDLNIPKPVILPSRVEQVRVPEIPPNNFGGEMFPDMSKIGGITIDLGKATGWTSEEGGKSRYGELGKLLDKVPNRFGVFDETKLKEAEKTKTDIEQILGIRTKTKTKNKLKLDELTKQETLQKTKQKERLDELNKLLTLTKEKTAQATRTILKIAQKQRQDQLFNQLFRQGTQQRQRQPRQPRVPQPRIPLIDKFFSLPKNQQDEFFGDMFEVFGKRKGKDILLARKGTLGEAQFELKKFLVGTLGASGLVKQKGQPLKINLGTEFRIGKRDPFRIVQKKGGKEGGLGRLSSYGERKEIQFFRKKSKVKGIGWFD